MKKRKNNNNFQTYFYKSTIVAIAVTFLTLLFQLSTANLLLFSCLGASAVILVNQRRYSNTSLRIVFESYILTSLVAIGVLYTFNYFSIDFPLMVLATMLLSSLLLYATESIHPPAIGSGLAFLIFERSFKELGILLLAILLLLIFVRFMMYVYYDHNKIENFYKEFHSHRKKSK